MSGQQQMPCGRHRDEFGETLQNTEKDRFQEGAEGHEDFRCQGGESGADPCPPPDPLQLDSNGGTP
jgi:hypothetical protein